MRAYLIGALLFTSGVVVFVVQNTALVSLRFLNWSSPKVSLALVILLAACAGALITFLLDSFRLLKHAKKLNEINRENKKLTKELESLRQNQISKQQPEQDESN